jgi:putative oxidoreductase
MACCVERDLEFSTVTPVVLTRRQRDRRRAMSSRKLFGVREHSKTVDLSLLLIRLVAGIAFMFHGWGKIQNPFGWMGPDGFAPGFLQALAALSEFGGGLAWVLGVLTPLASFGIASTMAVASYFHAIMQGDPFVSKGGGPSFELAAVYCCLAVLLIAIGPGRVSLDRLIFGRRA